ncbi:hypothetical protein JCGZ_22439 [Jatropha curcas]|uniref:Uncharacterized protein n=1 Tax=Jatropha curcas TaxID=180498 RepID=A0A067JQX9_JATCU|nr:hypothetical protein JCGZ_22439 [Jatropha curcas]
MSGRITCRSLFTSRSDSNTERCRLLLQVDSIIARSRRSKRQRAKDLREVLEVKRAKRALSNNDCKAEAQMPNREAPSIPTLMKEDQLEEAHKLLLEIKQAQLEALTIFQVKIATQREKPLKVVSWLSTYSRLIRVEEPSTPSDLPSSVSSSPSGSHFKIECSSVRTDSVLTSASTDKMVKTSVPLFELEKMIKKIVAASLEKFMRSDQGKEKVVIEDGEEAMDESEKREHVDDTWQDDEFFKISAKKFESEPIISEKFKKIDKKLMRNPKEMNS